MINKHVHTVRTFIRTMQASMGKTILSKDKRGLLLTLFLLLVVGILPILGCIKSASAAPSADEPQGGLPVAEPPCATGRQQVDSDRHEKQAVIYHEKEEYDLSYRIFKQCVDRGWIDARAFLNVMEADAHALATLYHENRLAVLHDNDRENPEEWPVARIPNAMKILIWKDKGITPKKDWLTKKEMEKFMPDASRFNVTVQVNAPLTLDECRQTLARYELLRKYVQALLEQTEATLVNDRPGDANLEALRADLLKLKRAVRINRTQFVSYDLVSPFLAETVRLRRIADDSFFQMLFNHKANAGKRLDAVSMLALACHKNILMSCTEDVRMQFVDTISGLRRLSKPVEWEHFTMVTTLLDSFDPAKKRGADAWWE